MSARAIRLDELSKTFTPGAEPAVDRLTLDIPGGSIVALIGPSGCGKTTTLRMINRLIEPTSGTIEIGGTDVTHQPVTDLRRDIGYVIQQVGLFPHRTIAANIATVPKTLGWSSAQIRDRIAELAALVGLDTDMLDRYPDELSGGQQQRVGVARALAADPPVLLMDEPFGAVDPIVRSRLQDELLALQDGLHKTIVLVTHDIDEALKLADRIALLNIGGRLEQYSTPDELLRAPANTFVEAFVGEDRGVKRLQLSTVDQLPFDQGPVVPLTAPVEEARTAMREYRSEWLGVVEDGVFAGWVPGELVRDSVSLADLPRYPPAGRVSPSSSLRNAMEVIMNSNTSVAVIDDEGAFGGVVTLESIRGVLGLSGVDPRTGASV
jgi:osmoprotectant transport system ATP-binding protein